MISQWCSKGVSKIERMFVCFFDTCDVRRHQNAPGASHVRNLDSLRDHLEFIERVSGFFERSSEFIERSSPQETFSMWLSRHPNVLFLGIFMGRLNDFRWYLNAFQMISQCLPDDAQWLSDDLSMTYRWFSMTSRRFSMTFRWFSMTSRWSLNVQMISQLTSGWSLNMTFKWKTMKICRSKFWLTCSFSRRGVESLFDCAQSVDFTHPHRVRVWKIDCEVWPWSAHLHIPHYYWILVRLERESPKSEQKWSGWGWRWW